MGRAVLKLEGAVVVVHYQVGRSLGLLGSLLLLTVLGGSLGRRLLLGALSGVGALLWLGLGLHWLLHLCENLLHIGDALHALVEWETWLLSTTT